MFRRHAIVSAILALSLLSAGIARAGEPQADAPSKPVDPYVAAFSYTPPPEKAPNSQGVTVAVAKASFFASKVPEGDETWAYQIKVLGKADPSTGEMLWFAFPQFQNLAAKLRRDVAEILYAKGFKVRGPYESSEAIPAADKKAIDLYFIPRMNLVFTEQMKKWKRGDEVLDMDIAVDGTITLEAQNLATRESLWTRTVPLEKIAFKSLLSALGYKASDRFNFIMNEVAKGIERQYPALMSSVSSAIDAQEIRGLKRGSTGKTGY